MKLSLQYYAMVPLLRKGKISTEQIFSYASKEEYDAIEYLLFDPSMDVKPVKELLDKYNLSISCVDCFFDFATCDEDVFQKQIEIAYSAVDKVKQLGSKYMMVVPAYEESITTKEEATQNIIKGLKLLVEYAGKKDIGITIEDYPNLKVPLCSIDEIQRILTEVPGLYLTFDTGNFLLAEDDSKEALQKLYKYVRNVHAKDWKLVEDGQYQETKLKRKVTSTIHGDGIIKFKELFQILQENAYDGYISVEFEGDMEDLEPIKKCTKNLRSILKQCKEV